MRRVLIAVACVVGVSAGMLFTVVFTLVCATLLVYYGAAGVLALLEQHRTVSEEMETAVPLDPRHGQSEGSAHRNGSALVRKESAL